MKHIKIMLILMASLFVGSQRLVAMGVVMAIKQDDPKKIKELLLSKKEGFSYQSLLAPAIKGGAKKVVQFLIKNGADVNDSSYGKDYLISSIKKDKPEIFMLLIKNGAKINNSDGQELTPLHYSIKQYYKLEIIKLLLNNRAKVCVKDKTGRNPLYNIIFGDRDKYGELLLDNGADLNAIDKFGYSPLEHFCVLGASKGDIKFALNNGANLDAITIFGINDLMQRIKVGDYKDSGLTENNIYGSFSGGTEESFEEICNFLKTAKKQQKELKKDLNLLEQEDHNVIEKLVDIVSKKELQYHIKIKAIAGLIKFYNRYGNLSDIKSKIKDCMSKIVFDFSILNNSVFIEFLLNNRSIVDKNGETIQDALVSRPTCKSIPFIFSITSSLYRHSDYCYNKDIIKSKSKDCIFMAKILNGIKSTKNKKAFDIFQKIKYMLALFARDKDKRDNSCSILLLPSEVIGKIISFIDMVSPSENKQKKECNIF